MQDRYDPAAIEPDAQRYWDEHRSFEVREDPDRPKYYCLCMFPYPSGRLHMGHVRNYTIGDVLTRYMRMQGCNVLQPMGWDAFGLPAENAAMANGVPPAKWTYDNIAHMKRQMKPLGLGIDWTREFATCRPDYYRWNQWLFLRMLERGIAYRRTGIVNWDPEDQTVLANEQVIDGRGWRTGALVEKREIPMYYLRITDYAEDLLAALDELPSWPERVKLMQANWIGRSEGLELAFDVEDGPEPLRVYTTRPDTLYGVTYMAVAAGHPLAQRAAQHSADLREFIAECQRSAITEAAIETMEKRGKPLGVNAVHPLTGERIPVWVANFVLMGYGTGAVMAVPAHDQRDWEFARRYGLRIHQVIEPTDGRLVELDAGPYLEHGRLINSGQFDGLYFDEAFDALAKSFEATGRGQRRVNWRLRDWGISRQRYWGCPIPLIHCETCGEVPVPDEDLPVILPENLVPDGSGNPLAKLASFVECRCPRCNRAARRETDTMDTFVDSSWYFFRYTSPGNDAAMVDRRADYWMAVDQYIGGIEHAILHLLYARFWTKVMRDMGLVKFDEPFTRLLTQGMLLNHIYFRRNEKGGVDYIPPEEVEGECEAAVWKHDGKPVEYGGVGKMGKSERNGVDPQTLIDKYGADTARLYIMFAGKPEDSAVWSDTGVEGAYRFLRRLWTFAQTHAGSIKAAGGSFDYRDADDSIKKARRELHKTLKQANDDYDRLHYNTVVSAGMIMLNELEALSSASGADALRREGLSLLLRILYPVVPHTTWLLWRDLGFADGMGDLIEAPWPEVDPKALVTDTIELVLQVNGKVRGKIVVPSNASQGDIENVARTSPEVARHANGAPAKKVIVVPGRLVNVVV